MYDDVTLLAIDPPGCGCTECIVGQYRPLQNATEAELRALAAGKLRDHTGQLWSIREREQSDGSYEIDTARIEKSFIVDTLPSPPPFEFYRIELTQETYERLTH